MDFWNCSIDLVTLFAVIELHDTLLKVLLSEPLARRAQGRLSKGSQLEIWKEELLI